MANSAVHEQRDHGLGPGFEVRLFRGKGRLDLGRVSARETCVPVRGEQTILIQQAGERDTANPLSRTKQKFAAGHEAPLRFFAVEALVH
jgi:hypothetical protein